MNKMTVRDIAAGGKKVLLRVDFNVPRDAATGEITDDSRIRAALPTISYLLEQEARIIICSHLGRPGGQVAEDLRLADVGQRLAGILEKPVATTGECVGPQAEAAAAGLNDGEVLLLENIRFHPGEETNDPSLAQGLARLADIYVNDAFGTAHRTHASIVGIAGYLPAVAGFLLEKEIETLGGILEDPVHPFATLLGGAKVSDKVDLMENIMDKVDYLLVGGGMAATFLKAKSYEVGRSLIEADRLDTAAGLMDRAAKSGVRLFLPVDVVVAGEDSNPSDIKTVTVGTIPPQSRIMDIGPRTVAGFTRELEKCRTIFWNGPMGMFEIPQFAAGTEAMVRLLAGINAATIIGGGSTAEAVDEMKLADKMTFVSTGGGASLKFLSGKVLPGVAVLKDKEV